MGDRYFLNFIECVYCGKKQKEEIYYNPTCNFETFECDNCDKTNFITNNFKAKKISDVTQEDVEVGYMDISNFLSEKEIKMMCKTRLKQIKKLSK